MQADSYFPSGFYIQHKKLCNERNSFLVEIGQLSQHEFHQYVMLRAIAEHTEISSPPRIQFSRASIEHFFCVRILRSGTLTGEMFNVVADCLKETRPRLARIIIVSLAEQLTHWACLFYY